MDGFHEHNTETQALELLTKQLQFRNVPSIDVVIYPIFSD
jgi:hypothetical protein